MARAKFTFPKARQDEFLDHIRAGMRRGAASDVVLGGGAVMRRRVREYIADHPDFEKSVVDAEVEATEHVEEALYQAAISGSVAAAKAWMDLRGQGPSERALRSPQRPTAGSSSPSGDPYADLDNVESIDRRRKR